MSWTRVAADHGMGLEAQWIYRTCNAPACSLKRDEDFGWRATLLLKSGIGVEVLHVQHATLEQAQKQCVERLCEMGWEREQ